MPHGSHGQPQLPKWYQDRYPTTEGAKKRKPYIAAVYDGPEYIDQWGNVIRAFGERYDGHPDLESVDIPSGFQPGAVELSVGLIDPANGEPKVRFAVEESGPDGWVPMHTIELTDGWRSIAT